MKFETSYYSYAFQDMSDAKTETFLEDREVRGFKSLEETSDFLRKREKSDKWRVIPLQHVSVIGVPNAPIVADSIGSAIDSYEGTKDALVCCMEEHGLLLKYYNGDKGRTETKPIRYTGFDSVLDRAGLSGRTMRNTGNATLSPEIKAEWLSKAISLYKAQNCTILDRDGKISTIRSDRYVPLDSSKLIEELVETLNKDFEDVRFVDASVSHETTILNLKFKEKGKDMAQMLLDLGISCSDASLGLQFHSSDVGYNAASVTPILFVDGMSYPIERGLQMVHAKGASLKKWEEVILPRIANLAKASTHKIEDLANISIKNPGGCLRYVACDLGFPKAATLKVASEFEAMYPDCTALDIYFQLYEIIGTHERQKNVTSLSEKIRNTELVAKALWVDYEVSDVPFEWKSA